jgi:predicted RNase H-related nuclease YkuK (DUF458 family)
MDETNTSTNNQFPNYVLVIKPVHVVIRNGKGECFSFFVPSEEARQRYKDVHDRIMNSVAAIDRYCADHPDHTFEEPIIQENIRSSIAAFKILREEFGDECIAYDTYNIVMSYSVRRH